MTDQLVTKETAVLAKLKGFDGKCFAGYDSGITNPLWLHSDGKFESLCYRDKSTVTEDCILVPTQAVLAEWLRIVHGIHVEIYCNASGWGYILTKLNGTTIKEIMDDIFFEEHDIAYEKGLEIALNMIKV